VGQPIVIEKWAENLEEVTLSRWLKAVGDTLAEGDSLCEIITDKVTFEYEIESPATLLAVYCQERSVLPVGYVMAYVGEPSEAPPADIDAQNAELLREHAAQTALHLDLGQGETGARRAAPRAPESRVRATPAARRVAREAKVAIEQVAEWAQPDGPVTEADVEAYVRAQSKT
jgi:pyruvate/2-oxoglutarate dehydrogenase complex dihydrolipoamide acyltransferase (E2) component